MISVEQVFLTAFISLLFSKLASSEVIDFACQVGIRPKLKKWKKKLLMIQAVLTDAEEKQLTDRAVKLWLEELRHFAYDLEDVLDELATEALERKLTAEHYARTSRLPRIIPACFNCLSPSSVKFSFGMEFKISGITSRLEELCEQRTEFGLQMIAAGTSSAAVCQRPPSTCEIDGSLVPHGLGIMCG